MHATVLGAGSWGTALAILLARNGHRVTLWGRESEELHLTQAARENLRYLPGFALPEEVAVVSSDHLEPCDLWVVAVPSYAVRGVMGFICGERPLTVIASKGIEAGSAQLLCEVALEACPSACAGLLSGPNLAVEIVRGVPTASVSAFADASDAERVAVAFNCRTFRVYLSSDVRGVELAGALKNVLAIAAGMSDGLGFGDNTKGALLARGLGEMVRLGLAMGGRMETFIGIAGVGDLFATAASTLSRNYRVGRALAEGQSLPDALETVGQTAEGVGTADCAGILARRHGVEMPVFEAVDAVLKGRLRPSDGVALLMERAPKPEISL
ncbi:MAG TPA: NAD(P)H-dependent glycerol-3-phosphate dehydrogenase [Fimbriimonadaceae bacterium]|nr:NAD(P)H-dependent glycerol-3-phosphate dehydrogenase [Fimbriimonadaceae bacterium]